jgi:hypothetical protein
MEWVPRKNKKNLEGHQKKNEGKDDSAGFGYVLFYNEFENEVDQSFKTKTSTKVFKMSIKVSKQQS